MNEDHANIAPGFKNDPILLKIKKESDATLAQMFNKFNKSPDILAELGIKANEFTQDNKSML